MNLILIRHAETEWNRVGRCQGFTDVELCDSGKRQVEELAKSLRDKSISAVYSSDLKRAVDTAKAIAGYHKLSVEFDPDLREMNQGELEGLTFVEIREKYAELLSAWGQSPETVKLPGGESLKELQERALRAIERIYKRHPEGTVVVVSHNLTIITLLCKFTGVGLEEFRKFKLKAASKNVILFRNGHFSVDILNDIAHLAPELIIDL
jgi:broad specificity phosphatase PhoE